MSVSVSMRGRVCVCERVPVSVYNVCEYESVCEHVRVSGVRINESTSKIMFALLTA